MTPKRYLAVGPSLPDAAQLVADEGIVVTPPIASGDLFRLPLEPGDVVGIVDGYFHHARAVRHKEILAVMAMGVQVLGGASMGALRAAELDAFGMTGIGQIYADYRDGVLEADDAVALLHGPPESGYRPMSEPFVNIRHNLLRARDRGLCDGAMVGRLLAALSDLPYPERSYARLQEAGREAGVDGIVLDRIARFCAEHAVDLKREDALLLIEALRSGAGRRDSAIAIPTVCETMYLHAWRLQAHGVDAGGDGEWISDYEVMQACQLFADDYPSFYSGLILGWLADACSRSCPPNGVEGLVGSLAAPASIAVAHGAHLGFYPLPVDPPALGFLAAWLSAPERRALNWEQRLERFVVRSFRIAPGIVWDEHALQALRTLPVFQDAVELVRRARAINQAVRQRHDNFSTDRLSRRRIVQWLAGRWGVAVDDLELTAFDRGIDSLQSLVAAARPLYLVARFDPSVPGLSVAAGSAHGHLC